MIREGAALAGNYEAALEDVFKRFTSLDRKIEEATRTVGEKFLPIFGLAVDAADSFLDWQTNAPDSLKTFEAAMLSTVAVGASLTAGYGALRFAGSLYTNVVGANSTALINSTAMLFNAGASAQAALGMRTATTAATLYTAATVRLTGALAALRAAAIAHPIIAGTAIAAGGFAIMSSLAEQAKQEREQKLRDAEVAVAERSRLSELRQEIVKLGSVNNRTARENTLLNSSMRESIRLLPDYAEELSNQMPQGASFPSNFNASSFAGAAGRFEQANKEFQDAVLGGLGQVSQIYDRMSDETVKASRGVKDVVGQMSEKEKRAAAALRGNKL